jgi:hypothetical protein
VLSYSQFNILPPP